jgi:hypothetical protein
MAKIESTILILTFTLLFNNSLFSQSSGTEYSWNGYHVKFRLPDNFKVLINNENEFKAGPPEGYFLFQMGETQGCDGCYDSNSVMIDLQYDALVNNVYDYESKIDAYEFAGFKGYTLSGKQYVKSTGKENMVSFYVLEHPKYPYRLHLYFTYFDINNTKSTMSEFAILWTLTPTE